MRKNKILGALKEKGKPISIEGLSEKIDIPVASLRVDLYRLQEEGEIESVEESGELMWKIKVSEPLEEKYEKMSKKHKS